MFVDTDADVLKAVQSEPGAMGLIEVHSVDNTINVVHVDGKTADGIWIFAALEGRLLTVRPWFIGQHHTQRGPQTISERRNCPGQRRACPSQ